MPDRRVSGIGTRSGAEQINREREDLVESARREEANGASRTRLRRGQDEDETRRDEEREREERKLD